MGVPGRESGVKILVRHLFRKLVKNLVKNLVRHLLRNLIKDLFMNLVKLSEELKLRVQDQHLLQPVNLQVVSGRNLQQQQQQQLTLRRTSRGWTRLH